MNLRSGRIMGSPQNVKTYKVTDVKSCDKLIHTPPFRPVSSYFERQPSALDWILFEDKFNMLRTDVVKVNNIYHPRICSVYVLKTELGLWNKKIAGGQVQMNVYVLINDKTWIKNRILQN